MVATRLRAAVMASGAGVCADAVEIEKTSILANINRRLDMGSSNDELRDYDRKLGFPRPADSCVQALSQGDEWYKGASGDQVCPDRSRISFPEHSVLRKAVAPESA
jgi:hypothetical protein